MLLSVKMIDDEQHIMDNDDVDNQTELDKFDEDKDETPK